MMNRSLYAALLCVLYLLISAPVFAQDFPMIHFSIEDGLPGNNIYQVYRDHNGFLWIGTDKGVARYNGLKFEVFTTFNGLPDNEVFFFREDLLGRMWLGTFNGELCYFKDDTFHTAVNTPFLKLPVKSSHTIIISPQKDSSVIVAFNNQSNFLNIHNGYCTLINVDKLVNNEEYGRLVYRQKITSNRYKLTFSNTALIADTNAQVKQRFNIDTLRVTETGGSNHGFTACQGQEYLFGSNNLYNTDMQVVRRFPPHFHENRMLQEVYFQENHFFYATNNGLFIDDTIQLLKGQNISSVTSDAYGNYWVSTLNNGIFVLRNNFLHSAFNKDVCEGKPRYCYAWDGNLFFVNDANNLFHVSNGHVNCLFNYSSFRQRNNNIPLEPGYLIDSSYHYHNLYNHDYIFMENVFSKKITLKYTDLIDGNKNLLQINDYIYLRRPGGVQRFRKTGDKDKVLKAENIGISSKGERIFGFAKDEENNIWYATVSSVYKIMDTVTSLQEQFKNVSFKNFEFLSGRLIGYTHDNQLLVCSNVNTAVTIDTVLHEDCIWDKFYKLDEQNMLISTNNDYRLLTIDKINNSRAFKVTQLMDPFIPRLADAICTDRLNCYFFKNGSVTTIDIKSILAHQFPPGLNFTTLKSGNQSCTIHDEVIIPFSESKNINISFSIVAYPRSKVTCQYSIPKNDRDNWIDVEGNDISLINSGYGSYRIRIRAKTASSDYSWPAEFTLVIRRPYWATWWFITFCICMATAAIVIISRKRLARALAKKDREHAMQVRFMKSEYKALNALMNPHFIFNTLNNVQGLINKNDKLAANEYLRVIADLIRQNMHNISKELIPLQKEIDLINNYLLLEKLRFKERLNYSIIIEKGLDLSDIMVPPLLIQPLVENSIKHGILPLQSSEGAIYINIYERKNVLYIEVRDNGVGVDQSKDKSKTSHESFGLENVKKRIEQLSMIQNKEITFSFSERKNTSGKLQWTIVTISMPI